MKQYGLHSAVEDLVRSSGCTGCNTDEVIPQLEHCFGRYLRRVIRRVLRRGRAEAAFEKYILAESAAISRQQGLHAVHDRDRMADLIAERLWQRLLRVAEQRLRNDDYAKTTLFCDLPTAFVAD